MTLMAIPKPSEQYPVGHDLEWLVCNCGHQQRRKDLDIRRKASIYEWEGDPDDFDLDDFITVRTECQTCSCCSEEDGEITRMDSDDSWVCTKCNTEWDEESDAVACCPNRV